MKTVMLETKKKVSLHIHVVIHSLWVVLDAILWGGVRREVKDSCCWKDGWETSQWSVAKRRFLKL